jgi:hypothetical protein
VPGLLAVLGLVAAAVLERLSRRAETQRGAGR